MSRARKNIIVLSPEERTRLETLSRNGHAPAKKILHARILLMADEHHPEGRWTDEQIGRALGVHRNTVSRIRQRFVRHGEGPALARRERATPPRPPKFDGAQEAQLIALCCSEAPAGHSRWTLNLLVKEVTRRGIVTEVCRETVRRVLKKTNCNLGAKNATASPSAMPPASSPPWKRSSMSMPAPTVKPTR
jgi:transposase